VTRPSNRRARENLVAEGKRWKRVEAAKPWRPNPGDSITGVYLGISTSDGRFGPYKRITVRTEKDGAFTVSGTVLISLVEGAGLELGQTIKIVFGGYKTTDTFRTPSGWEMALIEEKTGVTMEDQEQAWADQMSDEIPRQYKDFELFVGVP
jgi:hypothetical protein